MSDTALRTLLAEHYRPEGVRLGIALLHGGDGDMETAAAAVLTGHGEEVARRLARIHARVGEDDVRSDDLEGFLRRYGHEYCVAVFPTVTPAGGVALETEPIASAARAAGCALGWLVDATSPADPPGDFVVRR